MRRASVSELPSDILIRGRVGVEFPHEIPIVQWKCGLKTVSAMGDEEVSAFIY
jgi:hypothetical protein